MQRRFETVPGIVTVILQGIPNPPWTNLSLYNYSSPITDIYGCTNLAESFGSDCFDDEKSECL